MTETSKPISAYVDARDIRMRLAVLIEKRNRIILYREACDAGDNPAGVLDEKQEIILASYGRQLGEPFPKIVRKTLDRTIRILEQRLHIAEQCRRVAA